MFYDRYIELCDKVNEKPYSVSKKIGLGNSNVAQWKKGSTPRPEVLSKVAEYFGVTVEYLLAGEGQKNSPALEGAELSEDQKDAVEFVLSLSDEQLRQAIRIARAILKGEE